MIKWQAIFKTDKSYRAEIVKNILEQSGFNAIIINKKDSSYNDFGNFEIHVPDHQVLKALKIIEDEVAFL